MPERVDFQGRSSRQRAPAVPVLALVVLLLASARLLNADVSRPEIEKAIDTGVDLLISLQAEDGSWAFEPKAGKSAKAESWRVGNTALSVLALQHARSKRNDAHMAIKKGLDYILQHPPEPQTYSAGLVMQCLYSDGPKKRLNSKYISAYAWMLCSGQKTSGVVKGSWRYELPSPRPQWQARGLGPLATPIQPRASDNSNSQFGILGLVYAQKAGFQVPREVWIRARDHYMRSQHDDGGWDYQSDAYRQESPKGPRETSPTMNMTLAGTVSVYLCDEMLADKRHRQCKAPEPNESHEKGLKWITDHWRPRLNAYGWYACERLGMLIGYSDFGGHDWYQEGAAQFVGAMNKVGDASLNHGRSANIAFVVLFLSRGRNPIIINKLKREGDWNLHRYDLKNLVDHVSGPWQHPSQWRIITLDASIEQLLKVPILWISGHEALTFDEAQKEKLKEYVDRGGTILGEACCSKKAFDASFRELVKELWPECELTTLPKTHAIYTQFRRVKHKPALMGMALEEGQGRLGVIYLPHGISCRWEVGGAGAKGWLDVGACIYLYVDKIGKRMRTEPDDHAPAGADIEAIGKAIEGGKP